MTHRLHMRELTGGGQGPHLVFHVAVVPIDLLEEDIAILQRQKVCAKGAGYCGSVQLAQGRLERDQLRSDSIVEMLVQYVNRCERCWVPNGGVPSSLRHLRTTDCAARYGGRATHACKRVHVKSRLPAAGLHRCQELTLMYVPNQRVSAMSMQRMQRPRAKFVLRSPQWEMRINSLETQKRKSFSIIAAFGDLSRCTARSERFDLCATGQNLWRHPRYSDRRPCDRPRSQAKAL